MTAQSVALGPTTKRPSGMFLGFGTVFRKEMTEWLRGRAALIVAGVSIASAIFTTVIPFVVTASGEAAQGPALSMDPTANVLLGWRGGQTVVVIAVLATMALLSAERDRGTLAWSLTNPVSRSSIIAAKFGAAVLVVSTAAVLLPLAISVAVATVAYGGLPDLATIGLFALLFLALPVFFIGVTVALGTFVKSTAGVAGIAFAVMFVPAIFGGLLPIVNEISPTSIGTWALATATGQPASGLTIAGWLVSMVVLVIGAKLVFDRQEF
jgi:ABC-type transport system involved in multi-copper enzyme maturation permease subunit